MPADPSQDIDSRYAAHWPWFIQGYEERRLHLHLHFVCHRGIGDALKSHDFCAVYERADFPCGFDDLNDARLNDEVRSDAKPADQIEETVLISVGQFGKFPQRMKRKVVSTVRLQLLDDCLCVRMDVSDALLTLTCEKTLAIGADRELTLSFARRGGPGAASGEREREMVETGTEIVQAIANEDTQ